MIEAPIAGEEVREAFNDGEKQHMVDVKRLFSAGFAVRNVSLVVHDRFTIAVAVFGEAAGERSGEHMASPLALFSELFLRWWPFWLFYL
ncbi:MAG: DUF1461 domain-containing protein [Clostridia bacterium]